MLALQSERGQHSGQARPGKPSSAQLGSAWCLAWRGGQQHIEPASQLRRCAAAA